MFGTIDLPIIAFVYGYYHLVDGNMRFDLLDEVSFLVFDLEQLCVGVCFEQFPRYVQCDWRIQRAQRFQIILAEIPAPLFLRPGLPLLLATTFFTPVLAD